jgi:hypothetical protein
MKDKYSWEGIRLGGSATGEGLRGHLDARNIWRAQRRGWGARASRSEAGYAGVRTLATPFFKTIWVVHFCSIPMLQTWAWWREFRSHMSKCIIICAAHGWYISGGRSKRRGRRRPWGQRCQFDAHSSSETLKVFREDPLGRHLTHMF